VAESSAEAQTRTLASLPPLSGWNWRKLLLCVLLLSVYIPVDFTFSNFNINPQDIVFALVFLLFVAKILVSRKRKLKLFDKRILLPIGGLIAYGALQLPFVQSPFRISVELIQLLQIVLLVFILSGDNFVALLDQDVSGILKIFFYFSLIGAMNAIGYSLVTGNRFVGVWSLWFMFGSLSYGFFYSFYHLTFSKNKIHFFSLAIFTAAIVLSRTRGLWITIPLSIGFIFLTHKRARGRILRYSLVLLIVLTGFASIVDVPPQITSRFYSIFTGTQMRDARFYRWLTSALIFLDHPLGVGLGNTRYYTLSYAVKTSPEYQAVTREQMQGVTGAYLAGHSDWFTLLAETGLIGVFLYGWFWLLLMKDLAVRRIWNTKALVLATALTSIFASTFIGGCLLNGGGLAIIFMYYLYKRASRQETS